MNQPSPVVDYRVRQSIQRAGRWSSNWLVWRIVRANRGDMHAVSNVWSCGDILESHVLLDFEHETRPVIPGKATLAGRAFTKGLR